MNQLSAETTVDARSFMVYVERPEEEVKGLIVFLSAVIISHSQCCHHITCSVLSSYHILGVKMLFKDLPNSRSYINLADHYQEVTSQIIILTIMQPITICLPRHGASSQRLLRSVQWGRVQELHPRVGEATMNILSKVCVCDD